MRRAAYVLLAAMCALWPASASARTRTYYIAADPVLWNYAPSGRDGITGGPLPRLAAQQLGWTYRKVIYREYTDATFRTLKRRAAGGAYLGLLGPPIFAEVGDTIHVNFKNNASFPLSVHVHGLLYDKDSEGAPYADGTGPNHKADDAVPAGHSYRYIWKVPVRAGPGPGDGSSVMWMYHSHTDEVRDVNTGPIGPIVVTGSGLANPDGTPKDVDRQFFLLVDEADEQQSRLRDANLADGRTNPRHLKRMPGGPDNQLWALNGYAEGNLPLLSMHVGERVRWYVFASMSDNDFHTVHWHGETLLAGGQRTDVVDLSPMGMKIADMVPDQQGMWVLHSHRNFELQQDLAARYEVLP